MHGGDAPYAGGIYALYGTYPQLQVGVHRILHKNGKGVAPCLRERRKGVGNLLHGKGICRSARTYPYCIHAGVEGLGKMTRVGDLSGNEHACLGLYSCEPRQRWSANAFEAARARARFPHSGTEYTEAGGSQTAGGVEGLLFALGAAGACEHQRRAAHNIFTEKGSELQGCCGLIG